MSYWLSRLPERPKRYPFADSSEYFGEVCGGEIEGHGEFPDAAGDRYVGEFAAGVYEGVGCYFYDDGRVEASRFVGGSEVGTGVGWSADRREAYRLEAGNVAQGQAGRRQAISKAEADKLAEELGVPVPL